MTFLFVWQILIMVIFPADIASRIGASTVLVSDNARRPDFSVTEAAEPIPALCHYKTRIPHHNSINNINNRAPVKRITRPTKSPLSPCHRSMPIHPILNNASSNIHSPPICRWRAESGNRTIVELNTSPRKDCLESSYSHHNDINRCTAAASTTTTSLLQLSPRFHHERERVLSPMASPRMPSRQASFHKATQSTESGTSTTKPWDGTKSKTKEVSMVDSSPRKPQRRYVLDTAEILQEALDSIQMCDLGG